MSGSVPPARLRDRIAVRIASAVLRLASTEYRAFLHGVTQRGLATLDREVGGR